MEDRAIHAQDAQIWNAIDAGNFKQALKHVDKKLAKKGSDYYEVSVDGRQSMLPVGTPYGNLFSSLMVFLPGS